MGVKTIKFTDDTTVVGLIFGTEELMYRGEIKHLAGWCRESNLLLNVDKTKVMIINLRRSQLERASLSISDCTVESGKYQVLWISDLAGPDLE